MVRPIVVWEEGNEVLPSQGGFGIIGLRSPKISARTSGIRTERSPTSGSWRKARATLTILRRIARIRFSASVWAWPKCPRRPRRRTRIPSPGPLGHHHSGEHRRVAAKMCPPHPHYHWHSSVQPLDCDVSPFDNGKTQKEGVLRTYKGTDGYAPMMGYLGLCVSLRAA